MKILTYENAKIAVFSATMAALFLGAVLHKPTEFSETENRYLEQRPKLTTVKLFDGSFMKDYETFITDQFPERSFFMGLKTAVERLRGRTDDNGVYFGKDGYLFGKYDGAVFESETAENNISAVAEFVKLYADKFGKEHFKIALAPSSSEILKDKLPANAPVYNQTGFIDKIKKEVGEDFVIDLGENLKKHADEYIYFRTDHHWTTLGAYYGYEAIASGFGLEVQSLEKLKADTVSNDFLGTYDSKVNTGLIGGVAPDSITIYSSSEIDKAVMMWDNDKYKTFDNIYKMDALKGKDKYTVFFGGNHSVTDIKTENKTGKTLLIIKDSFAHSLAPFLIKDYDRIIMLDLRYFNKSLKKYLSENKITDLLVLYSTPDFAEDANIGRLLR